ncbi:MAG TPA: choice-of-anchor tandem repeat NxxGxxAF-containing protein [Edaphobacter sp.]|nr:choice-of-anchor tandem repeat NxxGxxAF-containing protein [Edaphobacter sp.]
MFDAIERSQPRIISASTFNSLEPAATKQTRSTRKPQSLAAGLLVAASIIPASAQGRAVLLPKPAMDLSYHAKVVNVDLGRSQNARPHSNFRFVNIADSTNGFTAFSTFPAINNHGAVAFEASVPGGDGIFKSQDGAVTTIAQSSPGGFGLFGRDPVINEAGTVAFGANIGTAAGIFTSDGTTTKTIVNTLDQGLIARFLGSPSINRSGEVAFFATRNGFTSQAIFVGNGGPLSTVLDTATSDFNSLQNVAINASGEIVFVAGTTDILAGMFILDPRKDLKQNGKNPDNQLIDIVDTNNPAFGGFGDPVINKLGTVANDVFSNGINSEILSGNQNGITPRTDFLNDIFHSFEHPSINDSDAVAFFAIKTDGTSGVFVVLAEGASPVPVIQTGDPLFGSTVTEVDLGRFALNNKFQMAFQYTLQDGRSGVAIASLQPDRRPQYLDEDDQ